MIRLLAGAELGGVLPEGRKQRKGKTVSAPANFQ